VSCASIVFSERYVLQSVQTGTLILYTSLAIRQTVWVSEYGPIHTIRHVSVPSPFRLRPVRMVCVHTVRRVHSPSRTAHDRRAAIISTKYTAHCLGVRFPLFVNY